MRLVSLKEGPRLNRQETLTERKAEEIRTNAEGNAGTQNEGRRDTKANVEAVDKTRIEDKKGDQDQRRRK